MSTSPLLPWGGMQAVLSADCKKNTEKNHKKKELLVHRNETEQKKLETRQNKPKKKKKTKEKERRGNGTRHTEN